MPQPGAVGTATLPRPRPVRRVSAGDPTASIPEWAATMKTLLMKSARSPAQRPTAAARGSAFRDGV